MQYLIILLLAVSASATYYNYGHGHGHGLYGHGLGYASSYGHGLGYGSSYGHGLGYGSSYGVGYGLGGYSYRPSYYGGNYGGYGSGTGYYAARPAVQSYVAPAAVSYVSKPVSYVAPRVENFVSEVPVYGVEYADGGYVQADAHPLNVPLVHAAEQTWSKQGKSHAFGSSKPESKESHSFQPQHTHAPIPQGHMSFTRGSTGHQAPKPVAPQPGGQWLRTESHSTASAGSPGKISFVMGTRSESHGLRPTPKPAPKHGVKTTGGQQSHRAFLSGGSSAYTHPNHPAQITFGTGTPVHQGYKPAPLTGHAYKQEKLTAFQTDDEPSQDAQFHQDAEDVSPVSGTHFGHGSFGPHSSYKPSGFASRRFFTSSSSQESLPSDAFKLVPEPISNKDFEATYNDETQEDEIKYVDDPADDSAVDTGKAHQATVSRSRPGGTKNAFHKSSY